MKNVFIFISSIIIIFLLGSCSKENNSSDTTTHVSCLLGSKLHNATNITTCVPGDKDDDDDDDDDSETYSEYFEKVLKDQISCNDKGKFYDYASQECTSHKLIDCTDENIHAILKKSGQSIEDDSNWVWSEHFCTGSSDEDSSDNISETDISQYRQCYVDKTEGVLKIYRAYDEGNNTVHTRSCTIEGINEDYSDVEKENNEDEENEEEEED